MPTLPSPPGTHTDAAREQMASGAFWWSAAVLLRWRWFVIGFTALAAAASIAIALLLPVWYASTARVLAPESSSGGLGAIIGELSPLASSFVGGGGGDYTRYLAILTSRSTQEAVVERFDLVDVYDVADAEYPTDKALEMLEKNVTFEVDLQYDFLGLTVLDQDPNRAAQIANYLVELLNERNEALALEGASAYRRYIEERYRTAELELDSARSELQAVQERYGIVELPAMAQGMMQSLADSRAEEVQAEVQYQALLSELGPENPQTQAAKSALDAARAAKNRLLGGGDAVMPVPLRNLPSVANEYARTYQEVLIQQAIIEGSRPLLEQARFDEERERTAVQVLDEAVPPARKSRPRRSFIVISSTVAGFMLAVLFALGVAGVRQRREEWAARLSAHAPEASGGAA